MKLNINAKELLALYNVLYERYEACYDYAKEYQEGDPRAATDEQLRQVYNRVKAIVVASLSSKIVDPLDSWMEGQSRRIGELKDQNEKVKQDARDLAEEKSDSPVILSAEDTEVLPDSYPRKRPPPPVMPRGGKYHGHRR